MYMCMTIFLPMSPSCASSLVELTLVDGDVEFLECGCGGGGGGGGGISSVGEPFDVASITHVCGDDGESNLVGCRFVLVDVGMMDREGARIDAKVIVADDSSLI